jgi:hypothetical protein
MSYNINSMSYSGWLYNASLRYADEIVAMKSFLNMIKKKLPVICLLFVFLPSIFAFIQGVQAQPFAFVSRDLLVGFRKLSPFSTPYELVVNIGQSTNYNNLPPGTRITITQFTFNQLTNAFGDFNNLSWAASGEVRLGDGGATNIPVNTIWVCKPRTDPQTQTTPYTRVGSQTTIQTRIYTIGNNAVSISRSTISNQFNTVTAVQENSGDPQGLSNQMGANGNYQNNFSSDVENTTPNNFTTPVRSDFYEMRPTGNVDPHTGLTTGPGAYLGYFELDPNGTLTFTAAGGTVAPPPPPPTLSIARSNLLNTVSFVSTNGAIYTLHFTNAAGLTSPLTSWPALASPLTGNGTIMSFQDSTSDAIRFYRVEAH